jgi:hypothetical protein
VKDLQRIEDFGKEYTNGEFQDRPYFGPSFLPFGKAGGLQTQRCQGFAVEDYGGTLGALTLKPSGFCNIGVKLSTFFANLAAYCRVRFS